jgi:drug/metabolite transporter (DMT)-like permease
MENIRGITLMVLAMAGFAIEDAMIKAMSASMPVGQVIILLGFFGVLIFWGLCAYNRIPVFTRDALRPIMLLRNLSEILATATFVTAVALIPLSTASAILQATPLAVTLGAAVFLGEQVGWRRWTAIFIGFFGVLLIVQPGASNFDPLSLLAVAGVVFLTGRDLTTRAAPRHISSLQLATYSFATFVITGLLMMPFTDGFAPMTWENSTYAFFGVIFGTSGFFAITQAMRIGQVAVVTPFRYTRLIFAGAIGMMFFGETPNRLTIIGASIVICAGLYTFARERALSRRNAAR